MNIRYEDLVGDPIFFATSVRDKRPLLRKSAFDNAHELLSFSDLDRLLDSEAIRPPYARITRKGATVREADFSRLIRVQLTHIDDAPDSAKMKRAFQTGATLTWNSMNHYVPKLRELTTTLSRNLGCRTDVVAFATPAGVQGFAPHLDSTEVFVIQISGTKKWTVWDTWRPRPGVGQVLETSKLDEPAMRFVMEPGDCLYLPWGTPHVAESQDSPSLHLSVTAKPSTWADLVAKVLEDLLTAEEFVEFPVLAQSNIDQVSDGLKDRLQHAAKLLCTVNADEYANALISESQPSFGIGRTDFFANLAETYQPLTGGERIYRTDPGMKAVILSWKPNDKIVVEVGSRTYSLPAAWAPGIASVNQDTSCSFASLVDILGGNSMATSFVRGLTDAGFLAIDRSPH